MSEPDYDPPLGQLLRLGEVPARQQEWLDYPALGLEVEHVPELIRMATDPALNNAPGDSAEVWAPLHAWRTLAQLGATEAAEPLLSLLQRIDEADDDWAAGDLPLALGYLGMGAVEPVGRYLANKSHGLWARVAAARSLGEMGERRPEAREAAVEALASALADFAVNDPTLNAFIISELIDLQAREALPVIRSAFQSRQVDCSIQGDYQDVEVALGERETRTIRSRYAPPPVEPGDLLGAIERLAEMGVSTIPANRTPTAEWLRTGRNDACPCGSGLKFKKCCLSRVPGAPH